jgi:uncharacterized protein
MKVFITGGLGFAGTTITGALLRKGHRVTVIERNPGNKPAPPEGVSVIAADASKPGPWQDVLAGHDAVINLAGVSIFTRWSGIKKEEIYNSRVLITRNVVDAIQKRKKGTIKLISASAVGYYGYRDDEKLSENDSPGGDFLARVCRDWESEALRAEDSGSPVVITRFGVILGRNGGAMDILTRIFRLRIGTRLGTGRQWFSWIHEDDLASAIAFLLEHKTIRGPVNFTAPNPVTNRELTRELNSALGTFPVVPPAPGFLLKMVMGEFGGFLLKGQRAIPSRLAEANFKFKYPHIREALAALFTSGAKR